MKTVTLVNIDKLKCHENIDRNHLIALQKEIEANKVIYKPVIVDRGSYVILDGHHRYTALKQLGAKRIPVYFVNYFNPNVRVYLRRKNLQMRILKEAIITMASLRRVFPARTTRHFVTYRPKPKAIAIQALL